MRRLIPLLVLLSIPLSIAPAEEDPLELLFFDVRALVAVHEPRHAPTLGPPGLVGYAEGYETEQWSAIGGDALADLIREQISPQIWDEGGDVTYRRGGVLIVKCPASTGRAIGKLLDALTAGLCRRVQYSVEVHELPLEAYPRAAAFELDPAALTAKSLRASASGVAWSGVPAAVSVTNQAVWLGDYDVEITQDSAIADPVVSAGSEGLALDLAVSVTSDGAAVLVEAFLQAGTFARPMRELDLARSARGSLPGNRLGKVQLPEYRFLAASATGLVRPGGALAIPVASNGSLQLVLIRIASLDTGREGDRVIACGTMTREAQMLALKVDDPAITIGREGPNGEMMFTGGVEDFADLIMQNVRPADWETIGNACITCSDSLVLFGEKALQTEVRAFLAALEKQTLRPLRLDLGLWSTPGPSATGPRESFEAEESVFLGGGGLQTLAGRPAFLVAGSTASHVADYEVEVARGSFIPKPVLARTFEGLVGRVNPRLTPDGRELEVDLSLLLSARRRPAPFDPGAHPHGPVELVEERRVRLDSTIRMTPGGIYVLDAGPDTTRPGRSLALVVRAGVE